MKTGRMRNKLLCLLVLVLVVVVGLLSMFYTYNSKFITIKKTNLEYAELFTTTINKLQQEFREDQPEPQNINKLQEFREDQPESQNINKLQQEFREDQPEPQNINKLQEFREDQPESQNINKLQEFREDQPEPQIINKLQQEFREDQPEPQKTAQRKIFLDCGANVASSVQFFRETYPDAKNYIIHSFEIDERLAPYFKSYSNHVLHCPVGVTSKNGTMTAYTESAWSPNKGKNNGKDMQWGGGTLYVDRFEQADIETGGKRKLSHRQAIPTIDLSMWIQTNTRIEDYVILKVDVEGAEFEIFKKMLKDGTFKWIDKLYGEYHFHQPIEMAASTKRSIMYEVEKRAMKLKQWGAEDRTYSDFGELHPIKVPPGTPGNPGVVYSKCTAGDNRQKVAIAFEVGMNRKLAEKVIATVMAYRPKIPVTLFVYGDFVEEFPSLVQSWASRFEIGIRGNHPYPHGHIEMIMGNWIKEAGISAELRLEEIGVVTRFYMPPCDVTDITRGQGRHREWRIIKPSSSFPPISEPLLTVAKYYKYRDVERVPKALRMINDQLVRSRGGVLSLDTDHPDSYMIIVFLLDYLVENSSYDLVTMGDCISSGGSRISPTAGPPTDRATPRQAGKE